MPPKKTITSSLDDILKPKLVADQIGTDLFKIEVKWKGQRIIQDLSGDLEVELSPEALNKALSEQTGRFAWWAMLEVRAKKALNTLERDLKVKRAELTSSAKASDPKLTVEAIKAQVELNPEIEKMEREMIEFQTDLDAAAVGRESLRQRKDSLMTISANMRSEMENGLSVKERAKQFFREKNDGR